MTSLKFRLATEADLPQVMTIVEEARQFLHERGIPQWQNGYPDQTVFRSDIAHQALYVGILNQKVVVMMTLLAGPDPNYQKIAGAWQQLDDNYLVMHRIAVARQAAGQGIAEAAFEFAINQAQQAKKASFRIDTHEKNQGMRHLAAKFDFTQCGTVWMVDGSPRLAFELVF